jgi:hypothetical protein
VVAVSSVIKVLREVNSSLVDIDRARRDIPRNPAQTFRLMKVTGAAAISGYDKRWLYTVQDAMISSSASGYVGTTTNLSARTYNALSVSELNNGTSSTSGSYSWGVAKSTIPAGFVAVAIPNNSYVVCVHQHSGEGDILLIINTQAIDGTCA